MEFCFTSSTSFEQFNAANVGKINASEFFFLSVSFKIISTYFKCLNMGEQNLLDCTCNLKKYVFSFKNTSNQAKTPLRSLQVFYFFSHAKLRLLCEALIYKLKTSLTSDY